MILAVTPILAPSFQKKDQLSRGRTHGSVVHVTQAVCPVEANLLLRASRVSQTELGIVFILERGGVIQEGFIFQKWQKKKPKIGVGA